MWLGLIEIREVAPPAGEEAVRWWLWTTLPTRTVRQVLTVLEIYHIRWRLEICHPHYRPSDRLYLGGRAA